MWGSNSSKGDPQAHTVSSKEPVSILIKRYGKMLKLQRDSDPREIKHR